jgi:hypothetical protein
VVYLGVAMVLLVVAVIPLIYGRARPKTEEYEEMEARRRAIEALHRI